MLFVAVSFAPSIGWVKAIFTGIFVIAGVIFPVMMMLFQMSTSVARGTVSSLASAVMYLASMLGSSVTGLLYAKVGGFTSVGLFTAGCFLVSLIVYVRSGMLPRHFQDPTMASSGASEGSHVPHGIIPSGTQPTRQA